MWEYLTIEHDEPAAPWLALLGSSGWELVQVVRIERPLAADVYQTTFKRWRPVGLWGWLRALLSGRAA